MLQKKNLRLVYILFFILTIILNNAFLFAQGKKALTFQDMMKFKSIRNPVISEDGKWIAYGTEPDRGDGEAKIHSTNGKKEYSIERGSQPDISKDSKWVVVVVKPEAVAMEKAKKDNKPKNGMALLNTSTGEIVQFEKVQKFEFSEDSKWLAYHLYKEDDKKDKKNGDDKSESENNKNKKKKKNENVGSTLILYRLTDTSRIELPFVTSFAFDSTSHHLAYAVYDTSGKKNGLYYRDLVRTTETEQEISVSEKGLYLNLVWTNHNQQLAFLAAEDDEKKKSKPSSLLIWNGENKMLKAVVDRGMNMGGWIIPSKNELRWSRDGKRLFFGTQPKKDDPNEVAEEETGGEEEEDNGNEEEIDLYDTDALLKKREVDVWHWNDPLINSNQKKRWKEVKDKTYSTVYHIDSEKVVMLADQQMPEIQIGENPNFALGTSDVPYLKEITWDGRYSDIYLVNLTDGSRDKIASRLQGRRTSIQLSPNGRYLVYYDKKHWHLYDHDKGTIRNLTKDLNIPFYNEDHDRPYQVPGYGVAGWVEGDQAVLIYDKYDIWQFDTKTGKTINITGSEGRKNKVIFRNQRLDREERFFKKNQELLLTGYHDLKKLTGFYSANIGKSEVKKRKEESKRYRFLAKAKAANTVMFTRESYTEFPDIWVSDMKFKSPRKISDVNPQVKEFAWGAAELVEWNSLDGKPLQGVLIKPGNYEPGKKYPVVVYFYRFYSYRLYRFNMPRVSMSPSLPFYTSNDYAIFLPDIRFEIGRPGFASTKCILPGVQKLIDMGIADPEAIGLHGHSWSGYQTAFIITQTDLFSAAIAGAPVSNMTSAYGGIRWGTGLSRQFQYEKTQSRIGGSLWESLDEYIENSPLFFADRIHTPLLIMFGNEDTAVPWYQGIELYMAMRRLEKDCIFLEYRGEPHGLRKYPNKLDYAMKMKEYFDHYLKGEPAADWITNGVPYQGK